jgi:hypothetical protein
MSRILEDHRLVRSKNMPAAMNFRLSYRKACCWKKSTRGRKMDMA